MRVTSWEYAVIGLTAAVFAAVLAIREGSGAAWTGLLWGALAATLFTTAVRLLTMPLQQELEALRGRVAELERQDGPTGPGG